MFFRKRSVVSWPSFLVRSLHYLSASADSQDSPATDRTGKARSSDQRECGAHHRSRGFGRPQKFSTVSLIRRYWDIRLKNFRSHPSSSRFIPKTVGGGQECCQGSPPDGDENNSGISFPSQEWRLDGSGIRCKRHAQRKRRAGKTCDRES